MTIWRFRPWFGSDWCSVLYANLRQPHIFKHQISGKNLVLHLSKYGTLMKRWCLDIDEAREEILLFITQFTGLCEVVPVKVYYIKTDISKWNEIYLLLLSKQYVQFFQLFYDLNSGQSQLMCTSLVPQFRKY